MTVAVIPATPEAIEALTDSSVVWGLGWAEIIAVAALMLPIAVQIWLLYRQSRSDKVSATLAFHREYASAEIADSRNGARRFAVKNAAIDWENDDDLSTHDREGIEARDLLSIMRFFHRLNVVRKRDRLDEELLFQLFGYELAWWDGLVFEAMKMRPRSRTIRDIRELADALKRHSLRADWDDRVELGRRERLAAGPVSAESRDQDLVRKLAYEIWQTAGEPLGRDAEHWEQACAQLRDASSEAARG